MSQLLTATNTQPQLHIQHVLRGPNRWCRQSTIEISLNQPPQPIDLETANRLLARVGIEPIDCSSTDRADQVALWIATALLRMQNKLGATVSFCAISAADGSRWRLAVEFEEERVARACLQLLERWLSLPESGPLVDALRDWAALDDAAYDWRLGNTTRALLAAATARDIPWQRLDDESLVQLGQGRWQRRLSAATTSQTSTLGVTTATNKQLTKQLLASVGLPVPQGRLVNEVDAACQVAEELGWPVVVKPLDADYGDGVSLRLTNREAVCTAFSQAMRWSRHALVEPFLPGTLFRLLVVDGQLVSAVRRESAYVVGDGQRTVAELVQAANHDPRRGADFTWPSLRAGQTSVIDSFAADDRSNDTIPAAGETVPLHRDLFLRGGGFEVERIDEVHPAIRVLATDAVRVVGLDIAGLDVIADDLSRAPDEQHLAILEVNPEPAIVIHRPPLCQRGAPITDAIIASLFPAGATGRVPLVAVVGADPFRAKARRLASQRRALGETVGVADCTGAWLDDRPLPIRDSSLYAHVQALLRHPRTDAVIVGLSIDDILREGVPFDVCDELVELDDDMTGAGLAWDVAGPARTQALECLRALRRKN